MKTIGTLLVVLSAFGQVTPPIAPGEPAVWSELDSSTLKGRPSRLMWSPDGVDLYLRTVEGTSVRDLKVHHYRIARGKPAETLDAEPPWAAAYWAWKSSKNFFGSQVSIQVDKKSEMVEPLNAAAGGKAAYLGDGRTDRNLPSTMGAKAGTSKITSRLMLMDQVVGEFVDEEIVPGYTFSWSPRPLRRIAYRTPQGRLAILTFDGNVEMVTGAHDVVLPAWSDDGGAIAYLDLSTKKKVIVSVVTME